VLSGFYHEFAHEFAQFDKRGVWLGILGAKLSRQSFAFSVFEALLMREVV
jgi:hypothetical protein